MANGDEQNTQQQPSDNAVPQDLIDLRLRQIAASQPLIPVGNAPATTATAAAPAKPALIPNVPVQRADAANPVPGTQHIVTNPQTGQPQYAATPYTTAQQTNPFLGIFAHADNIGNPVLRTLAKIASGVGAVAEGVGQGTHPELVKAEEQRIGLPAAQREQAAKTRLETAQAEEAEQKAKQTASGMQNWEPMQGEQFTQYQVNPDGSQGAPINQLWRNKVTGEQQWRPIPLVGAGQAPAPAAGTSQQLVPAPVAPAPAQTGGGSPVAQQGATPLVQAPATQFGTKQMTKPEDRNLDTAGVQRAQGEIAEATQRLQKLPPAYQNLVPPEITPQDTGASAKTKLAEYDKAVNAQSQQYAKDQAELNKQRDAEAAEDRKELAKKRNTYGYVDVQKPDGTVELQYMNQAKAEDPKTKAVTQFEPMSNADVKKDRDAIAQLNDVQTNVSKYRNAFNEQKDNIEHMDAIHRIMAGVTQNQSVVLSTLTLSALQKMVEQSEVADAWKELTPTERNLMIGFLRAQGAIIAYNRVISGSGRSNEKQLEIEEKNLPTPDVGGTVGSSLLDSFQENIGVLGTKFPKNLPGLTKNVRQEIEKNAPPTAPAPVQKPVVVAPQQQQQPGLFNFGNWNPT